MVHTCQKQISLTETYGSNVLGSRDLSNKQMNALCMYVSTMTGMRRVSALKVKLKCYKLAQNRQAWRQVTATVRTYLGPNPN